MSITSTPYGSGMMPNVYCEFVNNNQSFSSGLHVHAGWSTGVRTANSTRLTFGVAVRNNRHVNPPPHLYLDNTCDCPCAGTKCGGCQVNGQNPGMISVASGAQAVLLERNLAEVRSDINRSAGYRTINVDPEATTVVRRGNVVKPV